jgi:sugar phosphate isomerase/epimerase
MPITSVCRAIAYRPELINYEPVLPELVRAVPFGSGLIDYTAFFKGLREGGFDGVATFEMCSPIRGGGGLDNLDDYARCYLQWMREWLGVTPARGLQ